MAVAYNAQNVPYGGQTLTINSVAYIAENISVTKPTQIIERRDAINEPSGQVVIVDFVTATATLQLATTSTAIPTLGQTFTATLDGASATWIVTEVGVAYSQGDATKLNATFRKAVS